MKRGRDEEGKIEMENGKGGFRMEKRWYNK
jgi:hypothetical protein